jgi:O-antigen/teichoic acid export membrane protein
LVRRHDDWNEWIRLLNRGDIGRGARNFSWLMIGNYASYALSLVTVVLIARALGPERYGGINAAVAYVGMFAFLKLPGFDKVFVRAVARDPSCESREYAVMLGAKAVAAAAGLVAAIAVLPFMPFSAGERASAAIFATTLLTQPIGSLIGGVFQAHEDMKWVAVVGLVRQTSYIVAATVALYGFGIHSIEVFVFLLSTSYWLGLVASVLLVRRHIARPLRAHFELPSREVLKAGVVFSLFSFVVFLYTKVDVLMARTLLGATAAGLYAVALNLLERANGPFMLMTTAFFPTICRRLQDGASVPPRQLGATMGVFAGVAAAVAAAVTALSGYLRLSAHTSDLVSSRRNGCSARLHSIAGARPRGVHAQGRSDPCGDECRIQSRVRGGRDGYHRNRRVVRGDIGSVSRAVLDAFVRETRTGSRGREGSHGWRDTL